MRKSEQYVWLSITCLLGVVFIGLLVVGILSRPDRSDYNHAVEQLKKIDRNYRNCVGDLSTSRTCSIKVFLSRSLFIDTYVLKDGCTEDEWRACVAIRREADAIRCP